MDIVGHTHSQSAIRPVKVFLLEKEILFLLNMTISKKRLLSKVTNQGSQNLY